VLSGVDVLGSIKFGRLLLFSPGGVTLDSVCRDSIFIPLHLKRQEVPSGRATDLSLLWKEEGEKRRKRMENKFKI